MPPKKYCLKGQRTQQKKIRLLLRINDNVAIFERILQMFSAMILTNLLIFCTLLTYNLSEAGIVWLIPVILQYFI